MRAEFIQSDQSGYLDVGDGQSIFFVVSGNPAGKPVVICHGGPGSGHSVSIRNTFDPARWRIIQFDQRGAGRSTPHAATPGIDLSVNTTRHLVADMERLRSHLGVGRWVVAGGSWGATLAQAYCATHPERVSAALLYLVTTTGPGEVEWFADGIGRFFPEAFEALAGHVPEATNAFERIDAYHRLLMDDDPAVADQAARAWCDFEEAIVSPGGRIIRQARYEDPAFRLGFARLVTHYFGNWGFLGEGELLGAARAHGDIPAVLVHGRHDFAAPPDTAFALHRAWPGSRLELVETAGHDTGALGDALLRAATSLLHRAEAGAS